MTAYFRDLVPATSGQPGQDPYRRGSGRLQLGDVLFSATRNTALTMQLDGNLVLAVIDGVRRPEQVDTAGYRRVLWATGTNSAGVAGCEMQADGNLVVKDASDAPLWASGTPGNPGAFLRCQDDSNLVLYSGEGIALWTSNTQ